MLSYRVKSSFDAAKVRATVRKTSITRLAHAGAAVRLAATRGIRKRKSSSPAGEPPHTRDGRIKRAILFAVERDTAVVGTSKDMFGLAGMAHEHGGLFRGGRFPERPFMRPALEKVRDRLPEFWRVK